MVDGLGEIISFHKSNYNLTCTKQPLNIYSSAKHHSGFFRSDSNYGFTRLYYCVSSWKIEQQITLFGESCGISGPEATGLLKRLYSPALMCSDSAHYLLFTDEYYSKWDVAYIISTSCMVATLLRTVMLRHLLLLSAYTPYFVFQRTMVQIYKLFLMYQINFHFFLL